MSIKVKNLTKRYGEQRAIDSISFSVEKGKICGFLGPNGAGKTTTMKILSCFTTPTDGEAYVAGHNVEKDPFAVRQALGYLPEHNPLYQNMYVREYLKFVADLYRIGNKRNRIDEMIELTGLTRERHKPIRALSKGYRQRVGLAQAMIHDPEVLVLDEPTSGLDPNQLVEIRQLIQELGRNKTVLFSSHIMQEVEAICDRILIVNKGLLVADDTKDVLKQKIQGRTGIHIEFEKPVDIALLQNIDRVVKVEKTDHSRYLIWSDEDVRRDVFQFAAAKGIVLLEMKKADRTVESVFQQLTINEVK